MYHTVRQASVIVDNTLCSGFLQMSDQCINCDKWTWNCGRERGIKPLEYLQVYHIIEMEIYANTCKTRHWPQLTRHKSSKYPNFQVLTIFCFATCQKHSTFFLINMQIEGIRFVCWIELIPATPSACAVITNYRHASDGRLKPWILSRGPLPRGRNPNQHNWSDTQIRQQHSNLPHALSVSKGY